MFDRGERNGCKCDQLGRNGFQTHRIDRCLFLAPTFPWCLRLSPIVNEITEEFKGRIRFFKMNVLESPANQEIANNFGIMSTPTLLFLCKGRPVSQIVGFTSKEDLKRGLNDMLGRYQQCLSQSTELRPAYVV